MKIGIVTTEVLKTAPKGFYNYQQIGLAKALDKIVERIDIYKAVSKKGVFQVEKLTETKNVYLHLIPALHLGSNGFFSHRYLDKGLTALIVCGDVQLAVPSLYKFCKRNNIIFISYIGVTESHSTNALYGNIINRLARRNYLIYNKECCLAKTPTVRDALIKKGVKNVTIAPVGLDFSVINKKYKDSSKEELREHLGFQQEEKILLYIGRLTKEKRPILMLDILKTLVARDKDYRLVMIGEGELNAQVEEKIIEYNLQENVKRIEKIPNKEIWQYYRISDCFVNLNTQEIFGMCILEAMYYECKVVALHAPGPDYIIRDKKDGLLCENKEQIIDAINYGMVDIESAHKRVLEKFTWDTTAKSMVSYIDSVELSTDAISL